VPDCPDILISVRHPKKTFATWVIPGIEPDKRKGIIKDEANERSPGPLRDAKIRKARQAVTASHVTEWLSSTGLQAPQ
jgi:hypothetical protein